MTAPLGSARPSRARAVSRTVVAAAGAIVALASAATLAAPLAAPLGAQQAGDSVRRVIKARTTYEDLQMFSGVLNQIRVNHPDSVDTHELIMAAIQGMVQAADPHSWVVTAVRLDPDKERLLRDGKLAPVPITFVFYEGAPIVVSVAPGSSAAGADILPGDELVAVDGGPVRAESEYELEVTLAGQRKSSVRLTLERRRVDGSLVQLERSVKRERVDEQTAVPAAFMLDPQTGYVRITTFANEHVADDLHGALGRLEKQGMKRLVLDIRDNGGGIVKEAAQVAGEFLPKGAVVYTQEGRKADVADTGRVGRSFWSKEKRYPIVLLINRGSASASELLAGALQDHDRALVVGHTSFGKSLLMRGFPLPDGSAYVMVIGHVKTPCGRIVQRQYRGLTVHEYRRRAGRERDVAGRPACKTDGGRVVYGGGGIYPDVVLPDPEPAPLWLARLREEGVTLGWIAGHMGASGGSYPSAEALATTPTVAPDALAGLRAYALEQGVTVPAGPDADRILTKEVLLAVALAKFGEPGYYRVAASLDPEVTAAREAFGKAAEVLTAGTRE